MTDDPRALATVELLGVLTYAQLRAFETTAAAIRHAPDVRAADRVAGFADQEYRAYRLLRGHLDDLTDLPEGAIERQRSRVDAFFSALPIDDWWSACTFFAAGLPMAADFARAVAPALEEETAAVVVEALAGREDFTDFAVAEATAVTGQDPERIARARRLAAEITGSAFTTFQGAITDTDALIVLLDHLENSGTGDVLRETAVSLLEQHRRRMHALGLDTPE
jgi:hypothetical protein